MKQAVTVFPSVISEQIPAVRVTPESNEPHSSWSTVLLCLYPVIWFIGVLMVGERQFVGLSVLLGGAFVVTWALRQYNKARLWHHRQGTGHSNRVIIDEVDAPEVTDRMIASELITATIDGCRHRALRQQRGFSVLSVRLAFAAETDLTEHQQDVLDRRVMMCVRASDHVCRLGNGDYLLILEKMDQPRQAFNMSHRLMDKCSVPVGSGQDHASREVTVGMSQFPEHGRSADELVSRATETMLKLAERGRSASSMATSADLSLENVVSFRPRAATTREFPCTASKPDFPNLVCSTDPV